MPKIDLLHHTNFEGLRLNGALGLKNGLERRIVKTISNLLPKLISLLQNF
jgi:hypothetical protein